MCSRRSSARSRGLAGVDTPPGCTKRIFGYDRAVTKRPFGKENAMPMIDLTYPRGALDPDARAEAVEKLTAALLRNEGATDNDATRAMSWTVVHELAPEAINVGGALGERPVYPLV